MPDVTVPTPPPLATVRSVELVHAGTWNAKYGPATFTSDDLYAAVGALDCPAVRRPVLKFGHDGNHGEGDPAIGWIDNLAVTDDGQTLVGDYVGMPAWLAAPNADGQMVLASAYPDRSIEGTYDFRCQIGHTHPFALLAVALLGQDRPGVGTLPSLQSLADLYGVAASADDQTGVPVAVTVSASREPSMPSPRPTPVAASVSVEDVRRAYYDKAPWSHWIVELHLEPLQLVVSDDDTGKLFRIPVNVTGDDSFEFADPVEVRRRYEDVAAGVAASAGASQPVVFASRAESRPGPRPTAASDPTPTFLPPTTPPDPPEQPVETPAPNDGAPEPPAEPESVPEPKEDRVSANLSDLRSRLGLPDDADQDAVNAAVLASLDGQANRTEPDPQPEPDPEPVSEPALVGASTPAADPALAAEVALLKEQMTTMSAELAATKKEKAAAVKASVLDEAQRLGKFAPAQRGAWEANYDKAPDVCASVLASIAAGTAVPVMASWVTGPAEPDGDSDDGFDRQFGHLFPPTVTTGKDA